MKIVWKKMILTSGDSRLVYMGAHGFDNEFALYKVQRMPAGRPISLRAATELFWNEFAMASDPDVDDATWEAFVKLDIIDFATLMGYQIRLTGDEYDFIPDEQSHAA